MEYELALVLKVQPTDDAKSSLLQKIHELFNSYGFNLEKIVVKDDVEGRRKLSYPIKGELEGLYYFFEVKCDAALDKRKKTNISEVSRMLKNDKYLSNNILRYLIIKKENL